MSTPVEQYEEALAQNERTIKTLVADRDAWEKDGDTLRAQNTQLLAALEPFASIFNPAMEANAPAGDASPVWAYNEKKITLGDIKRARTLIASIKETK